MTTHYFIDHPKRSIAKSISWRLAGSLMTAILVFIFTRKLFFSLSIGLLEVFIKMLGYYLHERVWEHISWGRKKQGYDPSVSDGPSAPA